MKDKSLPWRVTVRFRAQPSDLLVSSNDRLEVERLFNQSLKQSLYLLYGNGAVFNNLSGSKQTTLAASVTGDSFNFSDYEEVCLELRPRLRDIQLLPLRVLKHQDHQMYQRPIRALEDPANFLALTVKSAVMTTIGTDPTFDGLIALAQGVQVNSR